MPRLRSHLSLSISLVVAALVLIFASPLLAQPASQTMTWTLSNATVTNATATGYEVRATATAQGQARVKTGVFTMKCTIEEKDGTYNLRGAWDITRAGGKKTIHGGPHAIKGTLLAEKLTFNPALTPGTINGQVLITPKRRHAGKETRAVGTFQGNEKFEGTLTKK